jgi:hypothetical protein
LNGDGSIGTWTTSATLMAQGKGVTGSTAYNGYIYMFGGNTGSGTPSLTSYYTSTARVQIGGSLDLVGLSGQSASEGNTGGTLTAGNTNVIGTLNVQDAAVFNNNVSINGTLTVKETTVTGNITVNGHIISGNTTGTTTIVAGAAATCSLTTPTVTLTGNDTAGTISITTATGTCTAGDLATVTFAAAYGATPSIVFSPNNQNATTLQNFYSATTTGFTLTTTSTPTVSTTYIYSYLVIQ